MRQQDKAAYEMRQAEVANKFGFEEAQPKQEGSEQGPKPVMINSGTSNDNEEEEKAELVRRLTAMEDAEEHDNLFDKPVAFGSGRPDQASLAAAMGRPMVSTTSVGVSCDADDGADHFIYADPVQDRAVRDLYESGQQQTSATTSTSVETSTQADSGTQCDPPQAEESKEGDSTERLMRQFEREMLLGPKLNAHIPDFIAAGLAQLRSNFTKNQSQSAPEQSALEESKDEQTGPQAEEETKSKAPEPRKDDGRIADYSQKRNIQFERYYRQLNVVPPSEWPTFYDKLKHPLDICFRVNTIDKRREQTKATLDSHMSMMQADENLRDKTPQEVLWYTQPGVVYTFNELSRVELRQHPQLKKFHRFIVDSTDSGHLFRQEKVSMIPVTLLNVEPNHSVLDMCAAPGSKSIQILEALHANGESMNTGMLIANDADTKRAYMLAHQTTKLNLPALFVTNNDARKFPNMKQGSERKNFQFDRILCDVPCSGDGTLRKNLGLWKNFHCHMGHQNHKLQLDILLRGLSLLKKDGRLVYSTCSFNPIENEAVVQAALRKMKDFVDIVDVSEEVSPYLRYRPGMLKWKVFHRGKGKNHPALWYQTWPSVPEWKRKDGESHALTESMFHEDYTYYNNQKGRTVMRDPLNLSRCMRFYPHEDNQGGFFCAVFKKHADVPSGHIQDSAMSMDAWANPHVRQKNVLDELEDFAKWFEAEQNAAYDKQGVPESEREDLGLSASVAEAKEKEKRRIESTGIKLTSLSSAMAAKAESDELKKFKFANLKAHNMQAWENIQEFFGIDDDFPYEYLYYQKTENEKNIVLLNPGLHMTMLGCKKKFKLETINLGLKIFQKNKENKSEGKYRLLQEALEVLMPHLDERRVIQVPQAFFEQMAKVADKKLTFDQVTAEYGDNLAGKLRGIKQGSAVIQFAKAGEDEPCSLTIWIGRNTVMLMIGKEEIKSFMR